MGNLKQFYRYENTKRPALSNSNMKNLYEGLYISAPSASYYNRSILEFLRKTEKPYFIDPFTFFLAQEVRTVYNQDRNIRRSYRDLIKKYLRKSNEEIEGLDSDDILLSNHTSNNDLQVFVHRVLDYQFNCFKPTDVSNFMEKYLGLPPPYKIPCFLLSPYIRITNEADYQFNKKLIESARTMMNSYNLPLYAVFCFTRSYIDKNHNIGNRILSEFPQMSNYAIWISDFDEEKDNKLKRMNSIKQIIQTLSNNKQNNVLNLAGSYLSVLFSKVGLTGLCSGVGTSNKRTARISSGGPVGDSTKIYSNMLKKVLPEDDFRILMNQRHDLICDCKICTDEIKSNLTPNSQDYGKAYVALLKDEKRYMRHFMTCRYNEIEHVENTDLTTLINELDNLENLINDPNYTEHINLWKQDI